MSGGERYYGHGRAAETYRPAHVLYTQDIASDLRIGTRVDNGPFREAEYASAYPSGAVKVMHDDRSVFFPPDVAPIVRGTQNDSFEEFDE